MKKIKFGSPAWRAKYHLAGFKKSKSVRRRRSSETRSRSMARKGRKSSGISGFGGGGLMNALLGAAIFGVAQGKIPMLQNPLVQVVGGGVVKGKGGIIGSIGNAAFTYGAVNLSNKMLGGALGAAGSAVSQEVFG
jgi:hypothetical protein